MPPKNDRSNRGRKQRTIRHLRRYLIICEDAKSSRDYFDKFPYNPDYVQIECVGTGMNTDSLMKQAIKKMEIAIKEKHPYREIWVVFDKDDFSSQQFNRAFELANNHPDIKPCWSNECFELWYYLHYNYRDTAIGRNDLYKELSTLMGKDYDKADPNVYDQLLEKIPIAIRNAKKLADNNTRENPSTCVHELVELLISLEGAPENSIAEQTEKIFVRVKK